MKIKNLFAHVGLCIALLTPVIANSTVIYVDNTDVGFTQSGNFTSSTFVVGGYYGSDYLFDEKNVVGDWATWDPTSSSDWLAGFWKVEMTWAAYTGRASNALVTIDSGLATTTTTVDQRYNAGLWNDLGTYEFSAIGSSITIDDSNSTSSQFLTADAVRFTFISAPSIVTVAAPGAFAIFLLGAVAIFLRLGRR